MIGDDDTASAPAGAPARLPRWLRKAARRRARWLAELEYVRLAGELLDGLAAGDVEVAEIASWVPGARSGDT